MTREDVIQEATRRRDKLAQLIARRQEFWGDKYQTVFGDETKLRQDNLDFYEAVLVLLRT